MSVSKATDERVGTYTCAHCKGVFEYEADWDPVPERKELWGDIAPEDCAVICDDCHQDFMAWFKAREGRA